MHRLLTMKRLTVLFFAIFAVMLGGMFAWQALVVAPGDRCEANGGWWDPETSVCARPISIAEVTGRPIGQSRAEASDLKNRELIAIEDRMAAAKAARDADAERQRAALAAQ
ncbi:MAG: hypothetical protein KKG14_06955 [Alphaproteobacteria bacterium]|nr:hypothetical protein [Alphaproteobacteria bacterium]MBU1383326.1 hypothetical protein [Alphaproteobacteria bacterium]MBU2269795.1 hypothetical protein [Alphaproteobacteria bacterium]MBU2418423.1 hypothetical protein [Alphaproteobacteria bacterium]